MKQLYDSIIAMFGTYPRELKMCFTENLDINVHNNFINDNKNIGNNSAVTPWISG